MPKEKSNLELKKFLPALAALARGAAGGATRRGMVGNLGGGGGDNDSGPDVAEAPDSDLASNISDMNRTKMYKAEPDEPDESEELVHEDVQTAKQRLKLLNIPADTAGQQAEDAGFNPNIPMPTPKFTGPNHPEGPGIPLTNGFTDLERETMERDDKAGVSRSDYPQTQKSLLKIMKGHEDPRQGHFQITPERGTPESEITQGQLPMSEAEKRNLGDPDKPFKEGWKTGQFYPYRHRPDLRGKPESRNRRADPIQDALLKIMKQPDRNDEIPRRSPLGPTHLTGPMMHPDDPTQVHNLPGAQASLAGGTMESQPGGGKITPVSRTQTMELPTQQEQEAWAAENAINYDSRGHLPPEEEAKLRMQGGAAWKPKFYQNSIENSLLKIMKVPSTPGTKPTEPGGISAATPNEASNPGGAAKLPLLPLQPQIQRKTEQAQRPIQSSIDKADYPSGLSDEEWKAVMEEKGKREQFGEVHQPKSDKGVYAEPHIQNSLLKLMKVHEDTEREHDAVEQVRGISDFRQHIPTEERTGGFTMTDAERAAAARYRTGELTGPEGTASREEALWGSTAPTPRHDLTPYAEEPTGGMARESTSPTAGERADTLREHGTPTATRAARMMAQRDKNPQRVQVHEPARGAIVASLLKLMKAPDAGMAASLRQSRATKHEQGKAKTAGATQTGSTAGRDLLGRGDLAAPQGGGGDAEAHALAGSAASLLGARSAQEFYGKLGIKSPQEFSDTGGVGNQPDPNTPGNVGAAANPTTPPQGSIGDGSGTGMPPTPKPDTAPSNTGPSVVPQGRKLPPKSNPVAGALNRIQKP